MVQIDERGADESAEKYPADNGFCRWKNQPAPQKQARDQYFDKGIAERIGTSAATGPASENKPTEHRNIVIPGDEFPTGALGRGPYDRFPGWNSVNDDIEETADDRAKDP